ncbi:amino acid adenylation domain-containing protein [Kitasatospora purpeofusca]|uniref:amino acid adenylation domain-containing protein n=1 Tax=Kitasatospora purpeofusca TaxID=67352 RepID=UPI00225603CB|nr:amino acid adenylation domain-containing protein [Kitasatospora purpeofusca]MCX4758349.1 amino acid adenylation domain-containing protein [Kitasatospora purpeofusca]WSR31197.1 amino acid adenylation domain-containing protein [Kitasatospora purpeofusca]
MRRYPERPAIVHHGGALTYRQLDELVRTLAHRLGTSPGVVAVPATHTPDTVVALLGILAAGGAYCPVDPAFPPQRQRDMLASVGCRTAVGGGLAQPGVRVVELPGTTTEPRAGTQVAPERTGPERPAYLLFTSGSTGQPKPVVTPRRAISAAVDSLRTLFGLTAEDRVLQFASLNWDTCFEEILPTLTGGAALVLDRDAHSGSFPRFLRLVERERIGVLDLPTAFWHELVLHLAEERLALPECVRLLVIGGEAANPARLADWAALDTGRVRLLNTYGSTETTLITHAVDLHGPLAAARDRPWAAGDRVPIGRALPHVYERISEQGELLIGGPAVALGYLGLPEATSDRFGEDAEGVRWYRTGDRVGRAPDSVLTHQGRLDGEFKVRGIRVDPAEVEAHLAGHPGVHAVAVTGATLAGRSALVAYVVPRAAAAAGTLGAELRTYLRDRVPGHLVPSRITVVPELVLTASGKVDRAGSHRLHSARGAGAGAGTGAGTGAQLPEPAHH